VTIPCRILAPVSSEHFSIAQVTPYGWEQPHEVNRFVERLSDELCGRGHRVVVVAPSDNRELIRESRATVKRCAEDPDAVFAGTGCAQVLGVGQSLSARKAGPVSLPLDVSRTIEDLLDHAHFDFVHVHEPFAPSASSAALRNSRALNIGTFHSTTERLLSTQVARKLVELVFGRLDGRTASYGVTRDLVQRFFPGDYRVIRPGADLAPRPERDEREIVEILLCLEEERAALRFFLRAVRRLPPELPWQVTIWSRLPDPQPAVPLPRAIRDRVRFVGPDSGSQAQHLTAADIVVAASNGTTPAPQMLIRAIAGGAVPVASRLPLYEEVLDDGDLGLLFEPRDIDTLAAQLARLVADSGLRSQLGTRVREVHDGLSWSRVADEFEALYASVAARRHDPEGKPEIRRRLGGRDLIHVDLHMHTNHSHDCATPVDKLLETAKERGLGAIAVTDHNEVSGALEARERANGIKVIVGEEVKTADQGEVIGLFIEEKIPRGLTLQETISAIRDQGGLVYVPHPFDRMHSVPDYEHLLDVVEDIDAIEVFNPRVAFSAFNEEAERFAAKYRIVAGAGSDSHVPQGLGSVKIAMRDFDGPEEFLESLRDADIVRKKQSLLYVQALKFIQTKSPAGRKATGSGTAAGAGAGASAGAGNGSSRNTASGRKSPGSGNK
jgi:predicted metal-dependent phosphoesterase TrpH/glycosyltransferase involved in cell wall biosynthesis